MLAFKLCDQQSGAATRADVVHFVGEALSTEQRRQPREYEGITFRSFEAGPAVAAYLAHEIAARDHSDRSVTSVFPTSAA